MMDDSKQTSRLQETAGGGVVYRSTDAEPEVLLIFRRGLWDLPKGKLEPEESIQACARREVSEEVGCSIPDIIEPLGKTHHTFSRHHKEYEKTTYWYAMQIPESEHDQLDPQEEEQIEKLEWVQLSKAQALVAFDNLNQLLSRFQKWYSQA